MFRDSSTARWDPNLFPEFKKCVIDLQSSVCVASDVPLLTKKMLVESVGSFNGIRSAEGSY